MGTSATAPAPKLTLLQEFKFFLQKYNVVALAVAFIIGLAATQLVQALVNEIITPAILNPLLSRTGADWKTWKPGGIGIGPFFAAVLNFAIMAIVVFVVVKFVLREDATAKR